MKKALFIAGIVVLGGLLSFFSFSYGSVEPDYGSPAGGELCKALVYRPDNYKEVSYQRGFPLQKSGTVSFDVECADANKYVPSSSEIARSWQFYANWLIYTSFLLLGLAFWLKKTKKH